MAKYAFSENESTVQSNQLTICTIGMLRASRPDAIVNYTIV